MPELPEVEFAASRLREAALGRTIVDAEALHPSLARSLTPEACQRLAGRRIESVARRAKIQLITLDDGQLLEVHFRMTGDWEFTVDGDPAPAYERVRIRCTDGTRISLTDSRAFAVMRLHAAGAFRLPRLGPEPLDDGFTADVLAEALRTRRAPIKPVLLDQTVLAGIGNIYASEALWVARIHPARLAASISPQRVQRLRDALQDVLRTAPVGRYYSASDAEIRESELWRVYGRESLACRRCARAIKRIVQAGRSTFYCGGCQR